MAALVDGEKSISAGWLLASVTCDCAKILKYQFGSGSEACMTPVRVLTAAIIQANV